MKRWSIIHNNEVIDLILSNDSEWVANYASERGFSFVSLDANLDAIIGSTTVDGKVFIPKQTPVIILPDDGEVKSTFGAMVMGNLTIESEGMLRL
jgi:hypothetical protein